MAEFIHFLPILAYDGSSMKQIDAAGVKVAIEEVLDGLPEAYSKDVFNGKCSAVYDYVWEMIT